MTMDSLPAALSKAKAFEPADAARPGPASSDESMSTATHASLINTAGRQRMLSQRIVLYTLLAAGDDGESLAVAREALDLFRTSHRTILADSKGMLRHELSAADPAVPRFVELADSAIAGARAGGTRGVSASKALVAQAAPVLQALQAATQACENSARRKAQAQKSRHDDLMGRIQDIAKEARIVSFNARVMAARAGPVGQEFAVVANVLAGISEQIQALARSAMELD